MYQKTGGGAGLQILNGYIRPFSLKGFLPFVISFALAIFPIAQILVPAIAFTQAPALRARGLGKLIILSLKMFLVTLLLIAPPLALYLLMHLLGVVLQAGPVWLLYILLGIMLFSAVSAFVRLPMALTALARGGSVREAVDSRFIKLLISACFGRYVASLACLLPLAFLALFLDLLPLWAAYILSAFLSAWMFMYLGYVMNHCYDKAAPALGLPANPLPDDVAGGRYARSALSLLLVISILGQLGGALAFNEDEALASGNYPKHQYTAEEYNEALEQFTRNGQLNQYTQLYYNADTGNFYCATKPGAGEKPQALVIAVAGFTADCLPGIGTAKNTLEAAYYKKIADDPTNSDTERAAARRMQYLKAAAAALSLAGPLGKAASIVTGKGVIPFLIVKAGTSLTDPRMAALISAADDGVWGWEMVGNTYNIVKVVDEDAGGLMAPFAPEVILGVPSPKPSASGGQTAAPGQQPDGPVSPNGDYSPFWGTYKGTLVCAQNTVEAYGVTGSFDNPEVTITLDKDGYMSLSYTFNSSFSYEAYGTTMSGTSTLPVSFKAVYLTRTLAGYMGDSSSGGFTATTTTRYTGEGYEDGGGDATTTAGYAAAFSVTFDLVRVNGEIQAVADGYVTQKADGSEQSLYMSFNITKTG